MEIKINRLKDRVREEAVAAETIGHKITTVDSKLNSNMVVNNSNRMRIKM